MLAHQSFEKGGKMAATKGELRPGGKVKEFYAINTGSHSARAAAALPTAALPTAALPTETPPDMFVRPTL